jgi:hypothetical protein
VGTKNNPGKWDCYHNAEPDEPMFVLLARDITAQYLVAAWVAVQCGDTENAVRMILDAGVARLATDKPLKERVDPKIVEASQCSKSMRTWLLARQLEKLEERLRRDEREGILPKPS